MIVLVAAVDNHLGIGYQGWMPWNVPQDLQMFKQLTMGGNLVMGRKTFDAIGKPLPGRQTFVVTNRTLPTFPQLPLINDLPTFLQLHQHDDTIYYICGGAQIYQQALPYCSMMYLSHIKGHYPADTYFPDFDQSLFEVIDQQEFEEFTRKVYKRK
jgi:dihydrofolate reductase